MNSKGHRTLNIISQKNTISYKYPYRTTRTDANGNDLSKMKSKMGIIRFGSKTNKIDNMKSEDKAILQNAYWVTYGQCSKPL